MGLVAEIQMLILKWVVNWAASGLRDVSILQCTWGKISIIEHENKKQVRDTKEQRHQGSYNLFSSLSLPLKYLHVAVGHILRRYNMIDQNSFFEVFHWVL